MPNLYRCVNRSGYQRKLSHFLSTGWGPLYMPEGEVDLLPNHRYLIQIESQQQPEPKKNVLQRLSERAMDLGVSDLASQHDHYLYGTDKR